MSVGDESVDILFIMGNDSESLPDELVCNSDHSEFTGFSVLPKPSICLPAFGIEPAGIPCGDIDKSSGVCVSVSVDVPSDVYRSSGLFVSRTDTEIPGHLFGILEVGEASGSDDKCCCERYAYTFDSCQQRELSAELDFDKLREFRLQPVTPLFKELDRFVYGMGRSFVRDRQAYEGASEIRHGRNLLGELTYDCRSRRIASPCTLKGRGFIFSPYKVMSRASLLSVLTVESMALAKFFTFSGFSMLTVIPATLSIYSSKAL